MLVLILSPLLITPPRRRFILAILFFRVCGVGGIIRDGTNDRKVRNNRVTTIINIVDDNVDVVDVDIDGIVLNDTMLGKWWLCNIISVDIIGEVDAINNDDNNDDEAFLVKQISFLIILPLLLILLLWILLFLFFLLVVHTVVVELELELE